MDDFMTIIFRFDNRNMRMNKGENYTLSVTAQQYKTSFS